MKVLLINSAFTDIYGDFEPTAKIGVLWISTGFAFNLIQMQCAAENIYTHSDNHNIQDELRFFADGFSQTIYVFLNDYYCSDQ